MLIKSMCYYIWSKWYGHVMNLNIQIIADKIKWLWEWIIAQRWNTTVMNTVKTQMPIVAWYNIFIRTYCARYLLASGLELWQLSVYNVRVPPLWYRQ